MDRTRSALDAFIFLNNASGAAAAGAAILFGATIAVNGVPSQWTGWIAVVAGVAHVAIAFSIGRGRIMNPTGLFVMLGPPLFYIWVLAQSIDLLRALMSRDTTSIQVHR